MKKLLLFLLLLAPISTLAAELTFKVVPIETAVGAGSAIEVWLDPKTKDLNAVEGVILLQVAAPADISWVEANSGESVLTLWPDPPEYSSKDKVVRFAGGVPGGFNQRSLLLRLRASPTAPGQVTFSWLGGAAYLNDGQGTKEPVFARSLTIALAPQARQEIAEPISGKTAGRSYWLKNLLLIILLVIISASLLWYGYKKFLKK